MPDEDEIETFTLLPEGTVICEPDSIGAVVIQFPRSDDAIIFWQFLQEWCTGKISLEIVNAKE